MIEFLDANVLRVGRATTNHYGFNFLFKKINAYMMNDDNSIDMSLRNLKKGLLILQAIVDLSRPQV